MTRPSSLVLDGNEIKLRLEAERRETQEPVHVDWLRFTLPLKSAPFPDVDVLFPESGALSYAALSGGFSDRDLESKSFELRASRLRVLHLLRDIPDEDFLPAAQARDLALDVAAILGDGFAVSTELRKGHDFYKHRWSIERQGQEVGWVGFGASSESPRQKSQAFTIHCNLYGAACTFAQSGWRFALADYLEDKNAKITRIDLALDFFDGLPRGIRGVRDDWHAGLLDHKGKRPKPNTVGPWVDGGRGLSFYFGSKQAGKQTNVYEKGAQLFGEEDATNWERIELRYGNKLRVFPLDILRRPADFFAGASDWHKAQLELFTQQAQHAEPVPCKKPEEPEVFVPDDVEDPDKVRAELIVQAEITRVMRWIRNTAGPSITWAFNALGIDALAEVFYSPHDPQRLRRFTPEELQAGVNRYLNRKSAPLNWAKGKTAVAAH